MSKSTKVRHIPRRSGVGIRLAIPRPWSGPHPLSRRAAAARELQAEIARRNTEREDES